jgi:hypothetical protein
VHGTVLFDFLNKRQKKQKQTCADNEMFCFKCKRPCTPKSDSIEITTRNAFRLKIQAKCSVCNTKIFRDDAVKNKEKILKIFPTAKLLEQHIVECSVPSTNIDFKEEK